jgi:hypothetical protein
VKFQKQNQEWVKKKGLLDYDIRERHAIRRVIIPECLGKLELFIEKKSKFHFLNDIKEVPSENCRFIGGKVGKNVMNVAMGMRRLQLPFDLGVYSEYWDKFNVDDEEKNPVRMELMMASEVQVRMKFFGMMKHIRSYCMEQCGAKDDDISGSLSRVFDRLLRWIICWEKENMVMAEVLLLDTFIDFYVGFKEVACDYKLSMDFFVERVHKWMSYLKRKIEERDFVNAGMYVALKMRNQGLKHYVRWYKLLQEVEMVREITHQREVACWCKKRDYCEKLCNWISKDALEVREKMNTFKKAVIRRRLWCGFERRLQLLVNQKIVEGLVEELNVIKNNKRRQAWKKMVENVVAELFRKLAANWTLCVRWILDGGYRHARDGWVVWLLGKQRKKDRVAWLIDKHVRLKMKLFIGKKVRKKKYNLELEIRVSIGKDDGIQSLIVFMKESGGRSLTEFVIRSGVLVGKNNGAAQNLIDAMEIESEWRWIEGVSKKVVTVSNADEHLLWLSQDLKVEKKPL